jgi:hypothetical protein
MNEIAEKHFKYTAEKTCKKTESENQVKGKVKVCTVISTTRLCPSM